MKVRVPQSLKAGFSCQHHLRIVLIAVDLKKTQICVLFLNKQQLPYTTSNALSRIVLIFCNSAVGKKLNLLRQFYNEDFYSKYEEYKLYVLIFFNM